MTKSNGAAAAARRDELPAAADRLSADLDVAIRKFFEGANGPCGHAYNSSCGANPPGTIGFTSECHEPGVSSPQFDRFVETIAGVLGQHRRARSSP